MAIVNEDPTLLKIRGESNFNKASGSENDIDRKTYIKKVASAILTVIGKHGSAKLKTVGAAGVSNAIKASIIARGEASKKGMDLVIEPSFDNVEFEEGDIKTAIVLKIVDRNKN